ncbi:MAG: heparinase II/III family protein [Bacteroidales bacterium]|nr:heparinase II/III family protein [Bacteroidales bacterium]
MKQIITMVLLLLVSVPTLVAQAPQNEPSLIVLNRNVLYASKQAIRRQQSKVMPAYERLINEVDKMLDVKPFSVMSKKQVPPSGDKHDYVSRGIYWWPNPNKPDGLPYIRKDGIVNPEIKDFTDQGFMERLTDMVYKLGLAYYFSGNEKYAAHAAKLLRTWFLDEVTKMNPNLNYGQQIPGICDGRGVGLIDTRGLAAMLDGVILLRPSASWTDSDDKALKHWFAEFTEWMTTSPIGLDEAKAKNNHGTYYDAQVVAFNIYTGKTSAAFKQLDEVTRMRFDQQLASDGSQPEELARTKPWAYCGMNLAGLVELAMMAEKLGVNLWEYQTPNGATLRKAIEWYFPYLSGEKAFPKEEITGKRGASMLSKVLMIAGTRYGADIYQKQLQNLIAYCNDGFKIDSSLSQLVFPLNDEGVLTDDAELFSAIDLDYPGLDTVKQDVARHDYVSARKHFVAYLKARKSPRWFFDWHDYNAPQSRNAAYDCTLADKYAANHLVSCSVWHDFGNEIVWGVNPTPLQYNEWTWQLSRHPFWQELGKAYWATGDEKYAKAFVAQLRSWIATNPLPDYAANCAYSRWRTIEAGIRTCGPWPDAFYYFLGSPSFDDDSIIMMVKSFYEHGLHLRAFPSHNNWLTMEMNGLFHIGMVFPEFKLAGEWRDHAANCLRAEEQIQFYPDGAQVELATGYHYVSLGNMLGIYKIASINNYQLPDGYVEGLEKAYHFYLNIVMPDGRIPALNDSGFGDCRNLLAEGYKYFPQRTDFQYVATSGEQGTQPTFTSTWMPWSGWYSMRSDWGPMALYANFDVGPFGAGHQHEDKLSPIISAYGKLLVTECGGYAYDVSQWRRYAILARGHNVSRVDGNDQKRRLRMREDTICHSRVPMKNRWISNERFDFGEGWYDEGFGPDLNSVLTGMWDYKSQGWDIDQSVTQYRALVFLKNKYWLLFDVFTPRDAASHDYASWFHFNTTKYAIDKSLNAIQTTDQGEPNIAIVRLRRDNADLKVVCGQEEPEVQGWASGVGKSGEECLPVATPTFCRKAAGQVVEPYVFYPLQVGEQLPIVGITAKGDNAFEIAYRNGEKEVITFGVEGNALQTLRYAKYSKKGKQQEAFNILEK